MDKMENQSSQQPTESSTDLGGWKRPETTSQARRDPRRSAWITAKAKQIFGAYRRDDFADPESFVVQLGMVLENYSDDVIERVSNPITGIQRTYKTPPSLAAISEACEDESERLTRIRDLARFRVRPTSFGKPARHQLFIASGQPIYPRMCERAESADPRDFKHETGGIWVPVNWYYERAYRQKESFRSFTADDLKALYTKQAGA